MLSLLRQPHTQFPPLPRRSRLSRWLGWVDWAVSAAMVGGLTFCWGGGYSVVERWQETHALVEFDPAETVRKPIAAIVITPEDKKQINCLAYTAWAEARNQGKAGLLAVMSTTVNRWMTQRFGKDICAVTTAHWRVPVKAHDGHLLSYRTHYEYSFWENPPKNPHGSEWRLAQTLAYKVYVEGNTLQDETRGSLYYENDALSKVHRDSSAIVARIGDHTFYSR